MRRIGWKTALAIVLILTSAFIFVLNYLIFHNTEEELFLLVEELGFIPIEVLVVTLIIDQLLQKRERITRLEKMNMVIGAFFFAIGFGLLRALISLDRSVDIIRKKLEISSEWTKSEFRDAKESVGLYSPSISCTSRSLLALRNMLSSKRDFILRLLENPNLLEHESFTDLLWAVSHLAEELEARADLENLPPEDVAHLENDIRRAYALIIGQWLDYMQHLQTRYPYLFSLSVRTNPFNPNARPEISA
jgi:hypothetical protein